MINTSNPPHQPANQPSVADISPAELSRLMAQAQEQASKVFKKIPLLGPLTWLMMQQSATKHTLISELDWRVMPPLMLEQTKLFMRDESPLAFVTWAKMSAASSDRYRKAPHHLMFSDWSSGDQVWLIDVVAPFGGAQEIMKDLRERVFAGQVIYQLVPMPDEPQKMLTWPAVGDATGKDSQHKSNLKD
jgi:cytolysin-activating lysine-acyltransferase